MKQKKTVWMNNGSAFDDDKCSGDDAENDVERREEREGLQHHRFPSSQFETQALPTQRTRRKVEETAQGQRRNTAAAAGSLLDDAASYKCKEPNCGKRYRQVISLQRHTKKHHHLDTGIDEGSNNDPASPGIEPEGAFTCYATDIGKWKRRRLANTHVPLKLPYSLQLLVWDESRVRNTHATYCYCGKTKGGQSPAEVSSQNEPNDKQVTKEIADDPQFPMLVCNKCRQHFHFECVKCTDEPLLFGDDSYTFRCALCNLSSRSCRASTSTTITTEAALTETFERGSTATLSWAQITRLAILNLLVKHAQEQPDFREDFFSFEAICAFVETYWDRICPGKVRVGKWRSRVEMSLVSNQGKFFSFDITAKKWALLQAGLPSCRSGMPQSVLELFPSFDLCPVVAKEGMGENLGNFGLAVAAAAVAKNKNPFDIAPEDASATNRPAKKPRATPLLDALSSLATIEIDSAGQQGEGEPTDEN
jgi:hypothetical protein